MDIVVFYPFVSPLNTISRYCLRPSVHCFLDRSEGVLLTNMDSSAIQNGYVWTFWVLPGNIEIYLAMCKAGLGHGTDQTQGCLNYVNKCPIPFECAMDQNFVSSSAIGPNGMSLFFVCFIGSYYLSYYILMTCVCNIISCFAWKHVTCLKPIHYHIQYSVWQMDRCNKSQWISMYLS